MKLKTILLISPLILSLFFISAFAQQQPDDYLYDEVIGQYSEDQPKILESDFVVESFVSGLEWPTTMTFLKNDLLILEKNNGHVRYVSQDGELFPEPVLDVSVSNYLERGLLGITSNDPFVYLFYTESKSDGGDPIGNNVYKYTWSDKKLKNPILLKSLPSYPDAVMHQGGVLVIDQNNTVFAIIGDQDNQDLDRGANILQNQLGLPDDTGVIIPVEPPGPYHAIGIRNSFGLAIDPVTGNMWQTENGPTRYDELNIVKSKFNGGWNAHSGPIEQSIINLVDVPSFFGVIKSHIQLFVSGIYGFFVLDEIYVYTDPVFSWEKTISPTGLNFAPSAFGKYENWLFVGDCNFGNIYKFELNSERNGVIFSEEKLKDLMLNIDDPSEELVFAKGFGCITDIEFNDYSMYVTSLSHGTVYKIFLKGQD